MAPDATNAVSAGLVGSLALLAQTAAGLSFDPAMTFLFNLGGFGVLLWLVLRNDAKRKEERSSDRAACDAEMLRMRGDLLAYIEELRNRDHEHSHDHDKKDTH